MISITLTFQSASDALDALTKLHFPAVPSGTGVPPYTRELEPVQVESAPNTLKPEDYPLPVFATKAVVSESPETSAPFATQGVVTETPKRSPGRPRKPDAELKQPRKATTPYITTSPSRTV